MRSQPLPEEAHRRRWEGGSGIFVCIGRVADSHIHTPVQKVETQKKGFFFFYFELEQTGQAYEQHPPLSLSLSQVEHYFAKISFSAMAFVYLRGKGKGVRLP